MAKSSPGSVRQRQNAEIRKPEIVKSFYETILVEGLEGASIAKVAKRIRIHPSLILHYFENKENLILALVDYVIEEYAALLDTVKLEGLQPEKRLTKLLRTLWSREYYEKIHIAGSFSIIAISFRNPRIHEKIRLLYKGFRHFLAGELQRAMDAGVIPEQDARRTAELMITMVEGSRHFRHFFISDEDMERYNGDMAAAAGRVLGASTPL